jgi:hypothetical protein
MMEVVLIKIKKQDISPSIESPEVVLAFERNDTG